MTKTKTKTKVAKKKATKKKKTVAEKAVKAKSTSTKKPNWSIVTYKQIEARRTELGYSKSAMASMLGVTNSTYHNWRRGTTVPHSSQQEQIADLLSKMTPAGTAASPDPKAKAPKGDARRGRSGSATKVRRYGKTAGDVGGGSTPMPASNPLYPANIPSVQSIAHITAAYISAQAKAPSAGSVYEFVRGLRGVLNE
jgi:DNA-binding transcriptional regulator YiaG